MSKSKTESKTTGMVLAVGLLTMSIQSVMAAPAETWTTTSRAACKGLTVGWTPTLAVLQQMVGSHWHPAPGPVPGRGILLLFATACPQSHIGKTATGAFTIGAVIVPVENPEDTHGINQTNAHGWAVVTQVLGPKSSPVMKLFKRHGFAVTDAKLRFTLRKAAQDLEPSISIVTRAGHMGIHAQLPGPAKHFDMVSALAGNNPSLFSLFTGPESASRREQGTAIVTAGGDTLFSSLGLEAKPFKVTLDQDFIWSFKFSDQPF